MMKQLKMLRACLVFGLALLLLPGCEFLDAMGSDCNAMQQQYDAAKAREGQLNEQIPTDGAFAMALVFNQETVNKMFKAASSWNYNVNLGVASVVAQLPRLIVGGGNSRCPDCLVVDIPIEASIIAAGTFNASVAFQFPVESRTIGVEKTEIYLDLKRAEFLKVEAMGASIPSYVLQPIQDGLKIALSQQLGTVHLFDVAAWEIGDNKVKLLAGAPKINAAEHTLSFGMYSNLIMALESSVYWDEAFPSDAEIGLHIHPELIRSIIARMMAEGHIDRTVQLTGDPSTTGSTSSGFGVTLAQLNSNVFPLGEYFNMGFRLWKTDSGCGYIDLAAGIKLSISDEKFTFGIGDIKAVGSAGSGTLYAMIINTLTSTPFFQQVLSFANITVNFNEISMPSQGGGMEKTRMGSQKFILSLNGNGISLYLNFLDL